MSDPPLTDAPMPQPQDACLLLEIVDHLDAMVAYWDEGQVCRFANKAYESWFGRSRNELLGITMKALLGPLYELNRPHIEAALRGERQVFERAIPRPDGQGMRHSLATYIPRVVGGRVVGMVVHVADVEPMKRLERELQAAKKRAEQLATHDFLTGLPNRLLLADRLEAAIGRAKRTGEWAYLLGIDVDHFKQVNDAHGHAAGDRFLVEQARRIKSCVREYDTVARVGGDEFVVLTCRPASREDGEALAARILEAARQPWEVDGIVLLPSLSIGIAAYPADAGTPGALMSCADRALYAAKRAGRDRFADVRCASSGVPSAGAPEATGEPDMQRHAGP